jgi:NAD(P)-dependent dehydrogenase (short-subunit alcohol dehydrogenase family)
MKALVTGGTGGMGLGVARALAQMDDVQVIILGRSEERGEAAVEEISRLASPARISFVRCDLARMRDVRAAVDEIRTQHETLDGLFINAGLGYAPRQVVTEDGMDSHFQVNYLSQFMLTLNLLELLEGSPSGGRVVFNATKNGVLVWDDLQMENKWGYEAAINQAMIAKRMFYTQLHEHYAKRPASVSCFGFQIHKTVWSHQLAIIPWPMKAMATVMKWFGQFISIDECGATMTPLFVEGPEETAEKSGRLLTWKNDGFTGLDEVPAVLDPEQREKLWRISLELCDDERTRSIAERFVS